MLRALSDGTEWLRTFSISSLVTSIRTSLLPKPALQISTFSVLNLSRNSCFARCKLSRESTSISSIRAPLAAKLPSLPFLRTVAATSKPASRRAEGAAGYRPSVGLQILFSSPEARCQPIPPSVQPVTSATFLSDIDMLYVVQTEKAVEAGKLRACPGHRFLRMEDGRTPQPEEPAKQGKARQDHSATSLSDNSCCATDVQ